jgi:adenylate cyclase
MPALSFRTALVIRVALIILVTMAIVSGFTYLQVDANTRRVSDRVLLQTVNLVDAQVGGLLSKVSDQANLMVGAIQPAPGDKVDLQAAARAMVEVVRVNAEIGNMSLVVDETGEAVRVDQLPNGSIEVQIATFDGSGQPVTIISRPYGPALQPSRILTGWAGDFRKEVSYAKARTAVREAWSQAVPTGEASTGGLPGLTVGYQLSDARGKFLGVVRATLTSVNLNKFVNQIGVGSKGFAGLLDWSRPGAPQIVALPVSARNLVREGNVTRVARTSEIEAPEVKALLERLANEPPVDLRDAAYRYSYTSDRTPYTAAAKVLTGDALPHLTVVVATPYTDFATGQNELVLIFFTFMVLAVCIGILVTMVMSIRISRPLVALAQEARHVQALQLEPAVMSPSGIKEVDELATAVENMKTNLRSLEKLVPAEYARWLISSGQEAKLGGERRHITTYFGDIIGFTSLSNDLAPEELMRVLTEYLDLLSNQVLAHGGTIDKFNGDDVMAFWGAPTVTEDHSLAACRSALASMKAVATLHAEWSDHGRPLLGASFGIATGDVIVGNVGNRQRMNYTVIGDSVNMASRLQGLNKFYGTYALISHRTRTEAGHAVVARWVDRVTVSGRTEAEDVYELMCLRDEATSHQIDFETLHQEARAAFLARQWETAEECMNKVLAVQPHDGPASILRARIASLRSTNLDPAWDGSHTVMGK